MTKDEKIFQRLKDDYDLVSSMGYTVLGVFLQGSQNYNLDYAGSDIDTKAVVLPSFEGFVFNKQPVSTTHILESNEHIDIKDIRLMHDCFRKQNINFVEILFTKYKYMNPEFEDLYSAMFENREKIAHYNNYAAINCIAGMVYEKHKAMEHPYPTLKDKIEKYGYDNKQLHHILRCEEFLKRYINGVPYEECLIPLNPQHLVDIKAKYVYNLEQAREIANNVEFIVKDIKQKYMDTHCVVINTDADIIMDRTLIDVLRREFKKEINN